MAAIFGIYIEKSGLYLYAPQSGEYKRGAEAIANNKDIISHAS